MYQRINLARYNEILRRRMEELLKQKTSWGRLEMDVAFNKVLADAIAEYYETGGDSQQ